MLEQYNNNNSNQSVWQEIGSIAKAQKPKCAKGNAKVANKRTQRNSTDSQICVKRFSSERESIENEHKTGNAYLAAAKRATARYHCDECFLIERGES